MDTKLKFRIHFVLSDGSTDSIILECETLEEIRDKANAEVNRRNARDAWSEELTP